MNQLGGSACVASVAAVIATIDAVVWPVRLRCSYCFSAGGVVPKVNLVIGSRNVVAAGGGVVNLMVTVGLLLLVDDEIGHLVSLYGDAHF
jgi:hypothetical protein